MIIVRTVHWKVLWEQKIFYGIIAKKNKKKNFHNLYFFKVYTFCVKNVKTKKNQTKN